MDIKKYIVNGLAVLGVAALCYTGMTGRAHAEAADAANTGAATVTADGSNAAGETTQPKKNSYRYTSSKYGYSMILPQKPVGVIPASAIFENEKGEILVFDNELYNLKKAWIVTINAFTDVDYPEGAESGTDSAKQKFITDFANKGGFEFVRFTELGDNKKGLYCVTAKEIDVDTDGDGVDDDTITADSQMIKCYFRGDFQGHFCVALLNNPGPTAEAIYEYEQGLLSFHQWPTTLNPDLQ